MKIKNYNLNDELILEIGKFSVLWNCFERFQCSNSCSSNKIRTICANISIEKDKEVVLATVLNRSFTLFCGIKIITYKIGIEKEHYLLQNVSCLKLRTEVE